jgi:hypothetical protein
MKPLTLNEVAAARAQAEQQLEIETNLRKLADAGAAAMRAELEMMRLCALECIDGQRESRDPVMSATDIRNGADRVLSSDAGRRLLAEHEAAMRVIGAADVMRLLLTQVLDASDSDHVPAPTTDEINRACSAYLAALAALPAPEQGQKPVSVTDADRAEGARRHYAEPGSHGCSPCCIVEIEEEARKVAAERAHLPGSPGSPCDCGEERDVFATCQACGKFLEHGHDCGGERHE